MPATFTWSGAASGAWSDPSNWVGGLPPISDPTTVLVFPANGQNAQNLNNDISSFAAFSLTFQGSYTLGGNGLTLGQGIIAQGGHTSVGTPLVVSSVAFVATAQTDASLQLSGGVTTATADQGIFLNEPISGSDGGGTVQIAGGVTGLGALWVFTGPGTSILSGNNPYSGATTVMEGTLVVLDSTALGTGTLALKGGNILADKAVTIPNALDLDAGGITGTANITFSGNGTLGGVINVNTPATVTFLGNLSGSHGGFFSSQPGTLVLSGTNTFGGTFLVGPNTVLINGSQPNSPITMLAGQLGGTGTLGPLNVQTGTIEPGNNGIGVLTVNGGLALPQYSQLAVQLSSGPQGYGQLAVAGGATQLQGATLVPTLGAVTPPVGAAFVVLSSPGGLSGTFANAPQGSVLKIGGASFKVSYDATTVSLVRVAENATPEVIALQHVVDADLGSSVRLTFSKPMHPIAANRLANYSVVAAGRDGLLGTRDDRLVRVRATSYDPATRTVTLYLNRRLSTGQPLKVIARGGGRGGLSDAQGHRLRGRFVGRTDRPVV